MLNHPLMSRFPFIIETCCRYIRVPQPLLHLGNIRFVIERICRARSAERMNSQPQGISNTDLAGVIPHHLIYPVRGHGSVYTASHIVSYRPRKNGDEGTPP